MYRFVVDHGLENDVIAFATDSICTTRDLNLKSSRLGDFSLDKSGDDAYYLQNGIYRFNAKWKLRGVGKMGGKTVEHVDTIEKDGRLYLVLMPTRSASLKGDYECPYCDFSIALDELGDDTVHVLSDDDDDVS
jgi:hypothetical protein